MISHVLRQIGVVLQESRIVFEALVAIAVVLIRLDQLMLKRHMLDRREANTNPRRYDSRDVTALQYHKRRETRPVRMLVGMMRRHVCSLVVRLCPSCFNAKTKVR